MALTPNFMEGYVATVRWPIAPERATKTDARIIDFVATRHPELQRMWDKRQGGDRAMGYRIGSGVRLSKQGIELKVAVNRMPNIASRLESA